MKGCRTCGLPYAENEFMDGTKMRPDCSGCRRLAKARAYQERKRRDKEIPGEKECIKCGPECGPKRAEEFMRAGHRKDGLSAKCKKCAKDYRESEAITKSVARRKEDGRIKTALEKYRSSHREEMRKKRAGLRERNGEAVRENERSQRKSRREKAIQKLGGACKKCGEDRAERLAVDHVHDNGGEERKKLSLLGVYGKILKMERPEEEYQILCHNHNREKASRLLKEKNKNDCPRDERRKQCWSCEKEKPIGEFVRDIHKNSGRKSICKECCCESRERSRATALGALGGACKECGESNQAFLEIDHVNHDGAHKRRSGESSNTIFRAIADQGFRKSVQLLCANCNMAKEWLRRARLA